MIFNDDRKFKENFLKQFPRPRRNTRNQFSFLTWKYVSGVFVSIQICQHIFLILQNVTKFVILRSRMFQLEQENVNNILVLLNSNLQTHSSPSLSNQQSISIPSNISNIFSSLSSSSSIASNISTTSDIFVYSLPPSLLPYSI